MVKKILRILNNLIKCYICTWKHPEKSIDKANKLIKELMHSLNKKINLYMPIKRGFIQSYYRKLDAAIENRTFDADMVYELGKLTLFEIIIYCCNYEKHLTTRLFPLVEAKYGNTPRLMYTKHTLYLFYCNENFPAIHFKKCLEYLLSNQQSDKLKYGLLRIIKKCNEAQLTTLAEILSRNEYLFNLLPFRVSGKIMDMCDNDAIVKMLDIFENKENLFKNISLDSDKIINSRCFQNYCNKIRFSSGVEREATIYSINLIKNNFPLNTPQLRHHFNITLCNQYFNERLWDLIVKKGFNMKKFMNMNPIFVNTYNTYDYTEVNNYYINKYNRTVYSLVTYCLRNLDYEELLKYEGYPQLNMLHYV